MYHSRKSSSFLSRAAGYADAGTLVPPKVSEIGLQPFASHEQESLARWLREPAWPRYTLNIYALEGYLTALLVLPVELQPGAWLPPIWNLNGWKIPPPIDTRQRYVEFIEFVLGFLRRIDRSLLETPPTFEPGLQRQFGHDCLDGQDRIQHWIRGFGRALKHTAQTRTAPKPNSRDAILTIATYIAGQPSFTADTLDRASINLRQAVLTLASNRSSRGPLGALPKQPAPLKESESLIPKTIHQL